MSRQYLPLCLTVLACTWAWTVFANAQDTGTSASVGPRSMHASAWHQGRNGFARSRSINSWTHFSRGLAVGWGMGGLNVSTSYGFSTPDGRATANTYQLGIGRQGAFYGVGQAVSSGSRSWSAAASGRIIGYHAGGVEASGNTDAFGTNRAWSFSRSYQPR